MKEPNQLGPADLSSQIQELVSRNEALSKSIARTQGPLGYTKLVSDAARHFSEVQRNQLSGIGGSLSALTTAASVRAMEAITESFQREVSSRIVKMAIPPQRIQTDLIRLDRDLSALIRPSFEASRLAAQVDIASAASESLPYLSAMSRSTASFSELAADALSSLTIDQEAFSRAPDWARLAPGVEQYAATQAFAVLAGTRPDIIAERMDIASESALDSLSATLEDRLAGVSEDFVVPYLGARAALRGQGPDWHRHTASSIRELIDHLLSRFAPDAELEAYFRTPGEELFRNGAWTRKAKLQFLYREIATGEYAQMAEADINLTLATFYPENGAVHSLSSPLTDLQMRMLWRRAEGCISVVLEAVGR